MIDIKYSGMCEGCQYADLEFDCAELNTGEKIWHIRCIHTIACLVMKEKTRQEPKSEAEN